MQVSLGRGEVVDVEGAAGPALRLRSGEGWRILLLPPRVEAVAARLDGVDEDRLANSSAVGVEGDRVETIWEVGRGENCLDGGGLQQGQAPEKDATNHVGFDFDTEELRRGFALENIKAVLLVVKVIRSV